MRQSFSPVVILALTAGALSACFEHTAPPPVTLVPAGPALPPLPGDAQPVLEDSVIQGFDPAAPEESIAGMGKGLSPSKLSFEFDRYEIGEIYQYEHYEFAFPFVVEGNEPVIITQVDSNCGCTDARLRADWEATEGETGPAYVIGREIPPGAHGSVIGTFDPAYRRGDKVTTITIRGNMQGTPLKLDLHAVIRPIFDVKPEQIRFGDVLSGPGKGPRPSQDVRVVSKAPFEILEWKRLPAGLKIEPIGEAVDTGVLTESARSFRVTLGGDVPEGLLTAPAIASTSLGIDLEFLISANVVGPIQYTPPQRVAFGFPALGEERTRSVEIAASMPGLVLAVPTAEILGDAAQYMKAEVEIVTPGSALRVKVTLPANTPAGSYPGILRLTYPSDSGIASKDFIISGRVKA